MSDAQDSGRLKEVLLKTLIDRVENGETIVAKDGETLLSVSAPAATLNAAISFLKQFPPEQDEDVKSDELSAKLKGYAGHMKFAPRVRPN